MLCRWNVWRIQCDTCTSIIIPISSKICVTPKWKRFSASSRSSAHMHTWMDGMRHCIGVQGDARPACFNIGIGSSGFQYGRISRQSRYIPKWRRWESRSQNESGFKFTDRHSHRHTIERWKETARRITFESQWHFIAATCISLVRIGNRHVCAAIDILLCHRSVCRIMFCICFQAQNDEFWKWQRPASRRYDGRECCTKYCRCRRRRCCCSRSECGPSFPDATRIT